MTGLIVGMRDVPCRLEGTTSWEGYAEEDWKIVGKRDQYDTMSVVGVLVACTKKHKGHRAAQSRPTRRELIISP